MLKRVGWVAPVVVLAGAAMVYAADVAETGAAATQGGAGVAADYSEPKKAVASFLKAVQSTDRKAIQDAIVVSPDQAAAVDTYLKLIFATNNLEKAAEVKFGDQAEQYFGISAKQLEARLKAVDDAPVKTVGDSAIISLPADETTNQPGGTIVLKKEGNLWKLDAATLFGLNNTKDQTDRSLALAAKMIPVTDEMTQEIGAGKFASAGEAFQEFWSRSLEVAKQAGGATTLPATQGN